jgi:hypothetical protein
MQTGINDERYVFNYPDDANVVGRHDWYDDRYIWKWNQWPLFQLALAMVVSKVIGFIRFILFYSIFYIIDNLIDKQLEFPNET